MSASLRARAAAAVASAGVLVIGWQAGNAGHPVASASPGAPAQAPSTASRPTATAPPGARPAPGGVPQRGGHGAPGGAVESVTLTVPAGASGTFTGATASHRYGSVRVTVTLADGRITALAEDVVSDGDRKSDQINDLSVPQLRSAILAASDGTVSTISGATYTTKAYLTSLQAALDEAS